MMQRKKGEKSDKIGNRLEAMKNTDLNEVELVEKPNIIGLHE